VSLLKLTPESERLRRLAKAHAAGELATDDYRRMRAEVINALGSGREPDLGDVTERREVQPQSATSDAAAATASRRPVEIGSARRWRWLLGGLLLTVAVLAVSRADAIVAVPPLDTTVLSGG
jgi:hypothetical protein